LQALRAQMNPHFIFNCLNAIQDFILMEEPEQAQHYLSSFSKLIRKTLDNSARTNISLTEEIDFLHIYLELERMRFVGRFTWNITVQPELKDREVEIPSMLVQPFVENAIRHGKLGGLERQGELNIEFSIKDEELVCVIDDNGIGINQSIKMKTRLPGEHELHAMEITNNRMRTLGEVHGNRVRYTLIDKTELTPAANGTRAEIFIPLTYDNVYNS
jgi:LytS/YehU family sensor histidine kinase